MVVPKQHEIWDHLNSFHAFIPTSIKLEHKTIYIQLSGITWYSHIHIIKRAWARMYHLSLSQVLVNFIGKCCTKLWTLIVVEVRDILSFHRAKTMLPPVEFCRNKQAMLVKMLTTMHTKKSLTRSAPILQVNKPATSLLSEIWSLSSAQQCKEDAIDESLSSGNSRSELSIELHVDMTSSMETESLDRRGELDTDGKEAFSFWRTLSWCDNAQSNWTGVGFVTETCSVFTSCKIAKDPLFFTSTALVELNFCSSKRKHKCMLNKFVWNNQNGETETT